jgi:rare lipoprotein A
VARAATPALALLLATCTPAPPPAGQGALHYVLESAWQAPGGTWFYPQEQFDYDATGIASVITGPHPPTTTDGEAYDPSALAGAHQTLQLPAIVRVTNLDNGRQILVRLNDRGPDSPARLIALTPRAALLLAMPDSGAAPVRVQTDAAMSHALADRLRDPTAGAAVQAAPRGAVQAADLPPPQGVRPAAARAAAGAAPASADPQAAVPAVPLRLPEAVQIVEYYPGQLYILASVFGRADYAGRQAAQLAGLPTEILHVRRGRSETFQVRAGPFATIAAADAALDQALRRGVTDSHIVVQ